jgi:hypothetical protein
MNPLILKQAKKIGVKVTRASDIEKKLDVYYEGRKIASIGDSNYEDYFSYLKRDGKKVAEERRRLYKIRHAKDFDHLGGFLAWVLLWNGD